MKNQFKIMFPLLLLVMLSCNQLNNEANKKNERYLLSEITFTTTGSSFSPVITVTGNPEILWTWDDGTTSSSTNPTKDYLLADIRINKLKVTPWSAIVRINIGYDANDGGDINIELVPAQNVSSVSGLELVSNYLQQWCSSYNTIDILNFNNFINLDTIECFNANIGTLNINNTPKLKRLCVESAGLNSLDLSGCPNLEDLRGAGNKYTTIDFGNIGSKLWHLCINNNPQLTNTTLFQDATQFQNVTEFFIWNINQSGSFSLHITQTSYISIFADSNNYTSLDLSGAFLKGSDSAAIVFRNNQLNNVNISGCVQITNLNLNNNNLNTNTVDNILNTLDLLGRLDGTVDLRNNSPPTLGLEAITNLNNKNWLVYTD